MNSDTTANKKKTIMACLEVEMEKIFTLQNAQGCFELTCIESQYVTSVQKFY